MLFRSAGHPQVAAALRGMGAVTAGLIIATGLRLISALDQHPLGKPLALGIAALCFIAVGVFRIPLFYVLPVLGGGCWIWVVRRLR